MTIAVHHEPEIAAAVAGASVVASWLFSAAAGVPPQRWALALLTTTLGWAGGVLVGGKIGEALGKPGIEGVTEILIGLVLGAVSGPIAGAWLAELKADGPRRRPWGATLAAATAAMLVLLAEGVVGTLDFLLDGSHRRQPLLATLVLACVALAVGAWTSAAFLALRQPRAPSAPPVASEPPGA